MADTVKFSKEELRELLSEMIPQRNVCDPQMIEEHKKILAALPGKLDNLNKQLDEHGKLIGGISRGIVDNNEKFWKVINEHRAEIKVINERDKTKEKSNSSTVALVGMIVAIAGLLLMGATLAWSMHTTTRQLEEIKKEVAYKSSYHITNPMHGEPLMRRAK